MANVIDERMHNSLLAVANLLLDDDQYRCPSDDSVFKFRICICSIIELNFKLTYIDIDNKEVYGVLVLLKIIDGTSTNKAKQIFASFATYMGHTTDFVEYVEETILDFVESAEVGIQ